MIELKNIHKSYRSGEQKVHVLKGIDMYVAEGELVSIMGSSGSGKSTLLNIIGILDRYDSGQYRLAGTRISELTESKAAYLRNRMIGFVFQAFNLLPFKNAMENVALPLYYMKVGRKERNRRAMQYLEMLSLTDRWDHMPNELSGGQKQRVAIARALVTQPKVILADEPTGALDSVTSQEIVEILKNIHNMGNTIIVVTHEHEIAEQTERQIILHDGLIAPNPLDADILPIRA
jgi:putative ABC transport system ATP-binding protein